LVPAEPSRLRYQPNHLVKAANPNTQPSFVLIFQVCIDDGRGPTFARVRIGPLNGFQRSTRARARDALSSESIDIKPQPGFEADALAQSGHVNLLSSRPARSLRRYLGARFARRPISLDALCILVACRMARF
jgi:hypothetical protein